MSEIQLNNEKLRINFHHREKFFDIFVKDDWQAMIWNLDEFSYWLVVRFTDGRYSPHQIVCVPDKEWFMDWAEENKGLFEIVYDPTGETALS
jgi:hypothetical protein